MPQRPEWGVRSHVVHLSRTHTQRVPHCSYRSTSPAWSQVMRCPLPQSSLHLHCHPPQCNLPWNIPPRQPSSWPQRCKNFCHGLCLTLWTQPQGILLQGGCHQSLLGPNPLLSRRIPGDERAQTLPLLPLQWLPHPAIIPALLQSPCITHFPSAQNNTGGKYIFYPSPQNSSQG